MYIICEIRRERGLVSLCADGTVLITVRACDLESHPVFEGDEIDIDEYSAKMASVQFADAYEAALSMLDRSAKTAWQISSSLARKGFVTDAIESVIARLTENRLIDDRHFAERMTESAGRSGSGIYAIKQKMRAKGISEDDIENAVSAIDPEEQLAAASALAKKLAPRYSSEPRPKARAKLSQALARRGFSWDVISSTLENINFSEEEFDEFC